MTDKLPKRWTWPNSEADEGAQSHSVFLRGLSLGALIGAAIAGSAIWDRHRRHAVPAEPTPDVPREADPKA